ncbi:unnamed protein product [Heligmosomoides polygyrus]|uniref:Uncharacterized protein n=1 Tax=Heligmosomoides polygyrus TaxID=6339 RepID=A0A3P8DRN5_HELPZ|nr:unnamed protein product [Heligmosomoides polygyrus]
MADAMRQKRSERENVYLLHDDAGPRVAEVSREKIQDAYGAFHSFMLRSSHYSHVIGACPINHFVMTDYDLHRRGAFYVCVFKLSLSPFQIRSALSSPASYLSQTPRNSSFVTLSLCFRRTSSVQSLRGSMGNLAGWRGSISNLAEDSVNLNSCPAFLVHLRLPLQNPSYRSFNAKKNTDKQREVIDRLSKLRESLRSREGFVERGVLPKHQITSPSAAVKI